MDRKELLENRQKLLDLLKLCEWDLILENYKDASYKIDDVKKTMNKILYS